MVRAYVLVKTGAARAAAVRDTARGMAGVKAADMVTGPYDVVLVVEVEDLAALAKLVTEQLAAVAGVQDTLTCVAVG